ncbi:hypothetical protein [Pseudomonas phage vB_PaeP_fHoPae04]|nr:hypothetical protein [Pseudomonas phage vB_PaeP_fHoPae04]
MTNSNGDRTQGHRRCYRTSEVTSDIYDAIHNIPAIAGSPKRPPDDDWVYYLLMVVLFISLCMAFLTPLITSKDTAYESQSLLRATETSGELTLNGGIYKATKVPAPHKGKQQRRGPF